MALRRPVESALRALVAVMDHVRGPTLSDRHVHRVEDELRLQVRPHGPADDPTGERIEDDRQRQKPGPGRDLGSLIDPPRSVNVCASSAACKVLSEVASAGRFISAFNARKTRR